jgi:phosphohistidine phosphatase
MDLFIMRHGEAGTRVNSPARDGERSLTTVGRREVRKVAKTLKDWRLDLDLVVTSPLKRAAETSKIVSDEVRPGKVEVWNELLPEAKWTELTARLSKLKSGSSVLLVGHEPFLTGFIGGLISDGGNSRIALKKSGVAKVRVERFVPSAIGELRWLLTAKQISML